MKTLEHYFIDWEGEYFGFGYGTGEFFTFQALHLFFSNLENGETYKYNEMYPVLGTTVFWLLLNILCHADIIEYGTSPRHGFLTENGKRLRDFVLSHNINQLEDMIQHDDKYIGCGLDYCNCEKRCNNPFFPEK